ncbi:hypothetical protein BH20ACT5_BH20ACT5_03940 [soil metagenome]
MNDAALAVEATGLVKQYRGRSGTVDAVRGGGSERRGR